jgi:hypothetical protein
MLHTWPTLLTALVLSNSTKASGRGCSAADCNFCCVSTHTPQQQPSTTATSAGAVCRRTGTAGMPVGAQQQRVRTAVFATSSKLFERMMCCSACAGIRLQPKSPRLVLLWHPMLRSSAFELATIYMCVLQTAVPTTSLWLPHGLPNSQFHSSSRGCMEHAEGQHKCTLHPLHGLNPC